MDPLREAARRDALGPALEGPTAGVGADGRAVEVAWSWAEMDRRADRAALRLAEAGVGPGDGVATLLPPSPEMATLLHAVPRIGAVLVPLHPRRPLAETRRSVGGLVPPRLLLAPGGEVGRLRRQWPAAHVVAVEDILPAAEEPGGQEDPDPADPTIRPALPEPGADTPAAVLLTSGSSGTPRAVPITHGNLLASARGAIERLRLDPMDTWMASLSPAHVGGLALLHRATVVGCSVVTRFGFEAEEFLELADAGAFTHASLVPTMLHRLLEARGEGAAPRAVRCILVGGAPTPRGLLRWAVSRRWPVALTYGLTEATSQVATAPPEQVRSKLGTVGAPLPGVGVAVRTGGAGAGRDGEGEILVRGPTVAPLPPRPQVDEVAASAHGGTRSVHVDSAGWLHTGDLGRLDGDGDLWITGRLSDRIVSGGVTVDPAEVEEVLREHPGVEEAAVVGLPDPEWGELVAAAVVPRSGRASLATDDVAAFVKERLGSAKRPRRIAVVAALPRNPNGKVDRGEVRRLMDRK